MSGTVYGTSMKASIHTREDLITLLTTSLRDWLAIHITKDKHQLRKPGNRDIEIEKFLNGFYQEAV